MTYELAWRSAAILHHIDRKYAFDKLICHHCGKNSFCMIQNLNSKQLF
jgi:hypothetical protein